MTAKKNRTGKPHEGDAVSDRGRMYRDLRQRAARQQRQRRQAIERIVEQRRERRSSRRPSR